MIQRLLDKASHPCVAVSGGRDSLVVLDLVREFQPDIDVLVFRTDFAPHQWEIIDRLIQLWDLTVIAPLPKASYLLPNGEHLARVDEYELGCGVMLPVLRDIVHADVCLFDLNQRFLAVSPLDFDCVFVGTKRGDRNPAMGRVVREPITDVGQFTLVAPIFDWSEEAVRERARDLPYSKEWYVEGDENFDTGNLLSCSRCVRSGTGEPVHCPKEDKMINGVVWDQQKMLETFRDKYGFEGE